MAKTAPPSPLNSIFKFVDEYRNQLNAANTQSASSRFPSFAKVNIPDDRSWITNNYDKFLHNTPNQILCEVRYLSELGYITALVFSTDGSHIVVGHSTGIIQVRNGLSGALVATLHPVQFPPKPVYALYYSKTEDRICYAASTDGVVYRCTIPEECCSEAERPTSAKGSINDTKKTETDLNYTRQFYFGASDPDAMSEEWFNYRNPALSLGITADHAKMAVGYSDNAIKVYDMGTKETLITYKMHKSRMELLPKKLRRVHSGQVSALACHSDKPNIFASGSWDNTLRIWDLRCELACVMTFEGVRIIGNSIDLNRDLCVAGSWDPLEALTLWDLRAHSRLCVVKAQNRRCNVDGEFIYACKFWRSHDYNRKGKYAIIGGSGTESVEIINLHNRYLSCVFPVNGTILALDSFNERIAYGGTFPSFSIARFHEPKHETEIYESNVDKVDVGKWVEKSAQSIDFSHASNTPHVVCTKMKSKSPMV